MKKRIMICLTAVMTVLFSISFLTACNSSGDDNNQTDNSNIQKELNASECSSELSGAISTSVAKDNYSIKIVGSQDEGRSFVANIKYDGNAQHVILNSTQDYLGVTTRQYSETYLFTRNGKYYSSKRTSENDSLPNPSELGKTEFDNATANYLLNSVIGKFTLNDSAEVTYTGSKTGLDIEVATTTVAEVSGVKTELFTSYSIKNGLVCSVFQRVSEYDKSDVPTVKTENTITVKYDIGVVELPSNIQVQ